MCKSQTEGGQRCASHARERLQQQSERLQEALYSGDPDRVAREREKWEDAAADYASTEKGHTALMSQAQSVAAAGDSVTEAMLSNVIARGEARRAANRDAAALIKTGAQQRATITAPEYLKPSTGWNTEGDVVTLDPHYTDPTRNACEHDHPAGQCTTDCAALVAAMSDSGPSDFGYDPTGTMGGAPRPDTVVRFDDDLRRVVFVLDHPSDCQCSDPIHDVMALRP